MNYTQFYKKYGMKNLNIGESSKLTLIPAQVECPTGVVGHWIDFNGSMGPSEHHLFNYSKGGSLFPVENLRSNVGNPRTRNYKAQKEASKYARTIPKLKVVTDAHRGDSNVVVLTYTPLLFNYSYFGKPAKYNQAYNLLSTMLQRCNDVADSGKVNIIAINLFNVTHDNTWYERVGRLKGMSLYAEVHTGESLFMLELHRWLNNDPSVFDVLDDEAMDTVNILWQTGAGHILVNIGAMHVTIEGDLEDHEAYLRTLDVDVNVRKDKLVTFTSAISSFGINYGKEEGTERIIKELSITPEQAVDDVDALINTSDTDVYNADLKKMTEPELEKGLIAEVNHQLKSGRITPNKRTIVNKAIVKARKTLQGAEIKDEELVIPDTKNMPMDDTIVLDKSMLNSKTKAFDSGYLDNILDKDITNCFARFAKVGVVINRKSTVEVEEITGSKRVITIEVQPVDGDRSTLKIGLPMFDEENTFTKNGTKYRLKKQMAELPIRKQDHDQVVLNSYYGKIFVTRSRLAVDSDVRWLDKTLMKLSMGEDASIKTTRLNIFDRSLIVPMMYGKLMMICNLIITKDYHMEFIHSNREQFLPDDKTLKDYEIDGSIVVGYRKKGRRVLMMDKDSNLSVDGEGVGNIYTLLDVDEKKVPQEVAVCKILGKSIALGFIFSFWLGLSTLLRLLDVKVVVVKPRQRPPKEDAADMTLTFSDCRLLIYNTTPASRLLIQGLVKEKNVIKELKYAEMDTQGTYGHMLNEKGYNIRFLRELELIEKLFIDPMTERRLKYMKEPTEIKPLLLRSVELLDNTFSPRAYDGKLMAIKGFERVAGVVYSELVQSTRGYKNQYNSKRKALEMSPYATMQGVTGDSSLKSIEDTNPIQYLKEIDSVTLGGEGGLNSRTLTIDSRRFDPNSLGIISESTLDNGDVGQSSYLSSDPQMNNLMGFNDSSIERKSENPASSGGTTYMINPFSDMDDPKRTSFSNVQSTHVIGADNYELPYVRTGYESVMPYRMGKLYCTMSKQDGKVTSRDGDNLIVTYKDGTTEGIPLGNQYGKAGGAYYPHNIITELKVGDKVKAREPLAWNKSFFKFDELSGNLCYTQSTTVRVAIVEGEETFEDSTVITKKLAYELVSTLGKQRDITILADTKISELVKVGQNVNIGDRLVQLETEASADNDEIFRDEEKRTLNKLTNNSPNSEFRGTIDRIEIFYNCELEDMTPELAKIAKISNRRIKATHITKGQPSIKDGKVNSNFQIKGRPIMKGEVVIRLYYTMVKPVGTGDKIVFANQLKTTVGEVVDYDIYSKTSGKPIGALFSFVAIGARIVISPFLQGFLGSYLKEVPNHLMDLYRK